MTTLTFDYQNTVVIVTGGSSGIGLALSQGFAAAGAVTYSLDMMAPAPDEAGDIRHVHCNVSDTGSVESAVAHVIEESGRIDVLVNNAGVLRDGMLWKASDEDFEKVLSVHAGGSFRLIRACVPHFRAQSYGRVINVTSYTGLHGNIGQLNYATAKAGLIGMTKTAAKELAAFGVTVNAISPNAETAMVASIPETKRAELTAQIPLGRFAEPSEMFPAVAFLASREAGYVTGVVLPVDGGLSM